jgi:Flp pilus assembly protein TadB
MTPEETQKSIETANQIGIYKSLLAGIIVTMIGVFVRFTIDATWMSILAWVILFVGAVWSCISVFKILDSK